MTTRSIIQPIIRSIVRPVVGDGGGGGGPSVVTAIVMGQSEMEYLFNPDIFYRGIPQPTPGNGNVIVWTQNGDGVAPVRTVVNPTTVAAGQVNPTIASWSAWFAYVRPNTTFAIGDGNVAGTGRANLFNASTVDGRLWTDFTSVVDAIEAEFGDIQTLVECWYNSDASLINNFVNVFWPNYFGANGDGSTFTLGTNNIDGQNITYCLWDKDAATSAKGRGIFKRATTDWTILTPMPFCDAPVSPTAELTQFTAGDRLEQPTRQTMIAVASNSLAQTVRCTVGPSAHLCDFNGGIHPVTDSAEGQILLGWPIAIAIARKAGLTINEPTIVDISGPTDGTYVDVEVDLPNGGNLTTYRILEGLGPQASPAPHQQEVTGFEHFKSGSNRPVFKTSETSYPASHRGTVTIVDTGSGSPRRGRVRITPEVPYVNGDSVSYLKGQASAFLIEPRDNQAKLYRDFLLEHIPSMYDDAATYPFPGVAVRPYQTDLAVPVPPPAFTPRGVDFDGTTSRLTTSSISVPAGTGGCCSMWLRMPTSWTSIHTLLEMRISSSAFFAVRTSSSGRLQFTMSQDGTGSDNFTTPTSTFVADQWYHILWSWQWGSRFQIYSNNVALNTAGYSFTGSTKFEISGNNMTAAHLGSTGGSAQYYPGKMGHVFVDLNRSLDFSTQANRELFALAGLPVNLGANGESVFGTAPEFYFDGTDTTFNNRGTVGPMTQNGSFVTASPTPGY